MKSILNIKSAILGISLVVPFSLALAAPANTSLKSQWAQASVSPEKNSERNSEKKASKSKRATLNLSGATTANSQKIVAAAKAAGAKRVKLNLEKGELKYSGKNIDRSKIKQNIEREVQGVNVKSL